MATIEQIRAMHTPEALDGPSNVYEVWHDGEITLTKTGDLYGHRGLHMIVPGDTTRQLPWDALFYSPWTEQFTRIAVRTHEEAMRAREMIRDLTCPRG